jgi:hypothetical protein
VDDEAVDLAFIGMHQDRATAAAGEIDRVSAGDQYRRGAYVMAGAGAWYDPQGYDWLCHRESPNPRREHNGLSATDA